MVFVCHGPIALLSAGTKGGWPFVGYRISVVSTADENLLESNMISWLIGPIEGNLIDYPDQALQQAGAVLSVSPVAGTPSFVKDREVISAQNPAAATAVGKILVRSIAERQGKRQSDSPVEGIAPNLTLADLAQMKRQELAALYSQGTAHDIPLGDTVGLGLVFTGSAQLNYLSAYIWQGKIFRETEEGVVLANKIFGYPRENGYQVDAKVKIANSLFDGKPAIQLDYSSSDTISARPIINEIRKVGAHIYLGRITFWGQDLGFFALYFVE